MRAQMLASSYKSTNKVASYNIFYRIWKKKQSKVLKRTITEKNNQEDSTSKLSLLFCKLIRISYSATSLLINDIIISLRRACNFFVTMCPGLFRDSLLGARSDPRSRRNELHRGDEDARGRPSPTMAREVEGSAWTGQRGQDKLQSNPRESARGQLQFVARPQEERSGARALERARSACTPSTYEALRQMPTDREILVSLKRAEKTRRSTTSTDRDRRRRRVLSSSGARCRHASKMISNKSGYWNLNNVWKLCSILS